MPITIGIELAHINDLGNKTVPIEIVVSTSKKMPNVLRKGVLRRSSLNINSTDYYYIEVPGKEEGEIILDLREVLVLCLIKWFQKINLLIQ